MNISIGTFIWLSFTAGIIATAGMTIFLFVVSKSGIMKADILKSIGSLFTKSKDSSSKVGLIIHAVVGIIFSFIYVLLMSLFEVKGFISSVGAGTLIGVVHAAVVSLVLIPSVAEGHPIKPIQKDGFTVAVSQGVAHIIYGFLIGLVVGMIRI